MMSILGLNTNYGNQAFANSSSTKSCKSDYAQTLREKFNYLNTSTSMNGVPTSVSVSPAFMEKCANNPKKSAYLEENLAVIPDCVKSLCNSVKQAPGSPVVTYASYQIDDNGNITMISGCTNDPDGKIARENAEKKAKEQKKAQEKLKNRMAKQFSVRGKSVRCITEKLIKKVDFSDTAKNSETFIRKTDCVEISEEARLALERDAKLACGENQSPTANTEDESEEVSERQGGKVAVNEGKRLRQIAAAATKEQVQQVLALLQKDMSDCKAGLEQGMCDESEIAKVEALLNQAKTRLSQVPNQADSQDPQGGLSAFELASLM